MGGWVWCDCRGDLELLGCFIGMVGGMCLVLVVLVGGVVLIALVAGGFAEVTGCGFGVGAMGLL